MAARSSVRCLARCIDSIVLLNRPSSRVFGVWGATCKRACYCFAKGRMSSVLCYGHTKKSRSRDRERPRKPAWQALCGLSCFFLIRIVNMKYKENKADNYAAKQYSYPCLLHVSSFDMDFSPLPQRAFFISRQAYTKVNVSSGPARSADGHADRRLSWTPERSLPETDVQKK